MMSTVPETVGVSRDKIRTVAKYQRFVILALLANIGLMIVAFSIRSGVIPVTPTGLATFNMIALAITVFILMSVILLARQFSNLFVAIICGLLMFIPLVSLLVLVVYNQKATTFLQQNGVKVGFLGISPNRI